LAGGAIRDRLLGQETADFDFAVDGKARDLARRLADGLGAHYYDLDASRDAGRLILVDPEGRRWTVDFARLRGPDITADLRGRDFTINAMAVGLDEPDRLLDPTGGLKDLKDKILRACSPTALEQDPVRALRAVRLATELNLRIDPQTQTQVVAVASRLPEASQERVRDEFLRLLGQRHPGRALRVLDHMGLLTPICPELESLKGMAQPRPDASTPWEHTLAVVDRLGQLLNVLRPEHDPEAAADLTLAEAAMRLGRFRKALNDHLQEALSLGRTVRQLLFFAALFHDAGKPALQTADVHEETRSVACAALGADLAAARARALRLSRAEVERITAVVTHHVRLESLERGRPITNRAVYRFFRRAPEAGVDAVLLALADFLGRSAPPPPQEAWRIRVDVARTLLEAYYEAREEKVQPQPVVRGDELAQALGLEQGPLIGELLEAIREAQAAGEVQTRDQALQLARRLRRSRDPRRAG
jgi:tRNA nucleotidyltransferase/poly(A) polymerase